MDRGAARRFGFLVAVCMGLLFLLPNLWAQSAADTSEGADDAGQAYREVAEKNFSAAIRDFRKALEVNPSNGAWRKDLGFACLAAGLPQDAAAEFTKVYLEHPDDLGVALQLGYLSQQLRQYQGARNYFRVVAQSADPVLSSQGRKALAILGASQLQDRKEKGYDLLSQHRTHEAIKAFESIRQDDPSDDGVTLQLGYLYAAKGRMGAAREMFAAADKDADPKIAAQADAGLEEIRRNTKPWFASFYAAPFYQSRFSNEINPATAKIGLSPSRYFQPYVGLRFSRDVRSKVGALPQIYSDNSAVISVGVQSTLADTGIVLYAEAGTAVNLLSIGPRAASDYRAGAVWFRPWGTELFSPGVAGRLVTETGSVYADAGFYSRYNHNFIGDVQIREGVNLRTGGAFPMQLLAAVNLVKDSNGSFYNNIVEVGPVLRIAPSRDLPGLAFETQYLRGFYDAHDPADPYGPRYGDIRIFLIWSRSF